MLIVYYCTRVAIIDPKHNQILWLLFGAYCYCRKNSVAALVRAAAIRQTHVEGTYGQWHAFALLAGKSCMIG